MDIIIQNDGKFYIQETSEPQKAAQKLETLKRIEQVVRDRLTYSAEAQDRFADLPAAKLYEMLRQKAWELQSEATSAKQAVEMGNICSRIEALVLNKLNLNADTLQHTLRFLPVSELKKTKILSRQFRKEVGKVEVQFAKKFGYKGENGAEAVKYLKDFLETILSKIDVPPELLVKGDAVATMVNIDSVPSEVLKAHVNKQLYCFANHPRVLRYLLSKGVDPNLHGTWPDALSVAISKFNSESVKILLEYGAKVNISEDTIFFGILTSSGFSQEDKQAIKEIILLLINAGADLNVKVRDNTPLSYAVLQFNDVNFVKLMLSKGAQVNFGGDQYSPLIPLYFTHNVEMAKCLLEAGANPNVRTTLRYPLGTPLLHFLLNQPQIVELFLSFGADVNVQDDLKNTSLIFAASQNLVETVKILLAHGARTDLKNSNKNTALDVARAPEVRALLS